MPVGALLLATEPPQMAEVLDLAEDLMAKLDALNAKVKHIAARAAKGVGG